MKATLPFICILCFSACSPRLSNISPEEFSFPTETIEEENFKMELTHVATDPNFIFFELWTINTSIDPLKIEPADFQISTFSDKIETPCSTDMLMQALHIEKDQVKKQRRNASILAGINLVSSVTGLIFGGGNFLQVVSDPLYSTADFYDCLLYTSPSPRDRTRSRMPSSA